MDKLLFNSCKQQKKNYPKESKLWPTREEVDKINKKIATSSEDPNETISDSSFNVIEEMRQECNLQKKINDLVIFKLNDIILVDSLFFPEVDHYIIDDYYHRLRQDFIQYFDVGNNPDLYEMFSSNKKIHYMSQMFELKNPKTKLFTVGEKQFNFTEYKLIESSPMDFPIRQSPAFIFLQRFVKKFTQDIVTLIDYLKRRIEDSGVKLKKLIGLGEMFFEDLLAVEGLYDFARKKKIEYPCFKISKISDKNARCITKCRHSYEFYEENQYPEIKRLNGRECGPCREFHLNTEQINFVVCKTCNQSICTASFQRILYYSNEPPKCPSCRNLFVENYEPNFDTTIDLGIGAKLRYSLLVLKDKKYAAFYLKYENMIRDFHVRENLTYDEVANFNK
jgi:hypothetical protein